MLKVLSYWNLNGRFMLTISENELKENMDAILEKKLDSILKKVFGNAK